MYIKNNPWIGAGLGNSNYVMLSYLQQFRSILGLNYAPVHNPVLTIWMETGLPGLLLFLSGLISATVLFIKLYIKNKSLDYDFIRPYFPIIGSVFCGYMLSWIKGGGIESSISYFLILALLLIPSCFIPSSLSNQPSIR
jgi:O-antigen ligase